MWPLLLRPPEDFWFSVSGRYGPPLCRPGVTTLTMNRLPGERGFIWTNGMTVSLLRRRAAGGEVDVAAFRQRHVGLLPVGAHAAPAAEALHLALDVERADIEHFHVEKLLDGALDLGLARIAQHLEHG